MSNKMAILGAGESGAGSAVLAKQQGFDVFVSDRGMVKTSYKHLLEQYDIPYEEGAHSLDEVLKAREVIKSPGIPEETDIVRSVREEGIPVISEIEFAGRYTSAYKVCITGSNGKTTTTRLTHFILDNAGLNVGLAGNVGNSFAYQVATEDFDYYVIELSSFQLDGIDEFRPDIAVLLNITPDHLDRYGHKLKNYVDSKFRITMNLYAEHILIYNADDKVIREELSRRKLPAEQIPFSYQTGVTPGAFIEDETMHVTYKNHKFTMSIHDLALKGKHNAYNSMAAAIAAQALNIRKDSIRKSLSNFKGVEHRLEHVLNIHGIEFINDSKATNVNSTWYALESMRANLIWIAGGLDKGNDYSALRDLVGRKVKAIICLGVDNTKIHGAFQDIVDTIVDVKTAEEAVRTAYYLGKKGDTVLLSPACASFDLFENYEDRGDQFKQAVRNL
ncbi:MAG: UDP-N-acetylmuramoyl-L-alanine--D-glutamate ligase [Bacteroidales bacterium]